MSESVEDRMLGRLRALTAHPDRHVGGPGNLAATEFFAAAAVSCGFEVERTRFDCVEWEHGSASLEVAGVKQALFVGPYSPACNVRARLLGASTVEEIEGQDIRGAVLLLYGAIAAHQVMPKNFTFYNPDSHKRIVKALETGGPAAVLAATGRDPEMVGSQYPFPLFEDGDLEFPSAYLTDLEGERLLGFIGREAEVRIDSRRVPATGEHVVARLAGDVPGRIVVTAHIDSRIGSPGALDNASGVAVLLGVMELLSEHGATSSSVGSIPTVEIVPFNGEDDYANPGEMLWVEENEGRFDDILLGINIDDAGMRDTVNHVSFYGCPAEIESVVRRAMERCDSVAEGPQWFQSDHAIFGIHGRPAIAIASSDITGFMARYAHSERDTVELADCELIARAAQFVHDVIRGMHSLGAAADNLQRL